VPIKNGTIGDDTRIRASLPTIEYALQRGAATVVLCSHLGRPKGKPNPEYTLKPVAARLSELVKRPVVFADDCVGEPAKKAIGEAGTGGGVVLLENLRFHAEEEKNDPGFARQLAELADVYVNDAFGSAHRAHASTEGIVPFVKEAAAGLLMAAEIEHLGKVLADPDRPFVAILGGAKVSDKLEVIQNLIPRVDALLIGGAMAVHVLQGARPSGRQIARGAGPARRGEGRRGRARQARGLRFELRRTTSWRRSSKPEVPAETLAVGDAAIRRRMGLDIGPATIDTYRSVIASAKPVVWKRPAGGVRDRRVRPGHRSRSRRRSPP
jgi:phosphoglycerate kinase